jgi:cobalt/nickel transport system ATP-binding protein
MADKKVIEIKGLCYSYPDGSKALEGVDLEILEGESVGIVGPNGAGKSTLLLHLNGILRGNSSIKIAGLEVRDENLPKIRGMVGVVFQSPDDQLFMPTVFDDVSFGPINMMMDEQEVRSSVKEALEEVEMADASGRSSHHLSFGEKKRVSVASVLSMNPKILALDEPTSNLDPRSRRHLINLLKNFDITKVIATHDLGLVREICQRSIILDKGRIVADGPTDGILSNKKLLESHSLESPFL